MTTDQIVNKINMVRSCVNDCLDSLLNELNDGHHGRGRTRSTTSVKNPQCVENGANSGKYTTGISKTAHTKRPKGSVMIKDMTIEEKRAYWRWSYANKKAYKNSAS